MIQRIGREPIDHGPSPAATTHVPGGVWAIPEPETASKHTLAQRRYRERQREIARKLDDVDFICSDEGQAWLEELNRQRARER